MQLAGDGQMLPKNVPDVKTSQECENALISQYLNFLVMVRVVGVVVVQVPRMVGVIRVVQVVQVVGWSGCH